MNQSFTDKHADLWGEIRSALGARYDVVLWCDMPVYVENFGRKQVANLINNML